MYKLRPEYQEEAHGDTIAHCIESYKQNTFSPAYHDHSVGAGKSVLIAFFAKHVTQKGRVLCLSRQSEIARQNASDAWAIGCKNSVYSTGLNKHSTFYPAIFGTEGTVVGALNTEFKHLKMDVLCIDECHEVDPLDVIDCMEAMKKGDDFYNAKDADGKPLYSQYSVIIAHFLRLNPRLQLIGYSGSPFRGKDSILGEFWKKRLSYVPTMFLVGLGFLVPPVFGFGGEHTKYDYSKFDINKNENFTGDYSAKELAAMNRIASKDEELTREIVQEVIYACRDRLGVLITCAGKAHCDQVAKYLPDDSYAVVTQGVSDKKRGEILDKARRGAIKYVLQINCLAQGVNVPRWDTLVILRKIGSKRYLTQLTGRVLRTLKDDQIEDGLKKFDGLILDYSDTFESMGDIFEEDALVAMARAAHTGQAGNKPKKCPKDSCGADNGEHAIRCCGIDSDEPDGRCNYFFKFSTCLSCETQNAPSAKSCRSCGAVMIDPNKALTNKAYTDADFKDVKSMQLSKTSTGKLCVVYYLDSTYMKNGAEFPEVAKEYFTIFGGERYEKARWHHFIEQHIQGESFRRTMSNCKTVDQVLGLKAMLDIPKQLTHRVNGKGFSIINQKLFRSGRVALSS